jgi:nucleotide-binding universal stress UspA family protein
MTDVSEPLSTSQAHAVFSKIVVPLNGTSEATAALAPARTMAKATGATVTLLTVVDTEAGEADHTGATTQLERVAAELKAEGIQADTLVRRGHPAAEIVAATREVHADLVAMATHGRSGLARVFLGSIAQGVLATSPVPVLLVRPGGHAMTRLEVVLVPVDGTPGGALALTSAVPLARAVNAQVVLLDVTVPFAAYVPVAGAGTNGAMLYFDPAWDEEATQSAKRYVSGMADRLQQVGVRARGMDTAGSVLTPSTSIAEALIQAADEVEADLIVMSTHALTGPVRTLLGSVADAVVRNSHRPVLLSRRSPSDETMPT